MCPDADWAENVRLVETEATAVRALARQLAALGVTNVAGGVAPPARACLPDPELLARCRTAVARCRAAGVEPAILVGYLARGDPSPVGVLGAAQGEVAAALGTGGQARGPAGSLPAALAAYLEHLTDRQYTADTRTVRRAHLRLFCAWAAGQGLTAADALTGDVLARYRHHLVHARKRNGDPLSLASQHTRLAHVGAWCAWLARTGLLRGNPAADVALPRLGVPLPPVLSAAEADRVLKQPNVATPVGVRDRAILETFYSTGMRRSELLRLALPALDRPHGLVTIRQGKGRRDRVVPIGAQAVGWLDRYLATVRPRWIGPPDAGPVFVTAAGAPLHPNHLSALVRGYVRAAALGKHGACHLFRHTMATLMLEGGADIRFIQQMLGHAKLTTTQLYTHVSVRQLQAVHAATHPAGRGAATPATGAARPKGIA
jgi:integrase/recombinase XerD